MARSLLNWWQHGAVIRGPGLGAGEILRNVNLSFPPFVFRSRANAASRSALAKRVHENLGEKQQESDKR
jgi:hypothetical protein